MKIAAAYIRVSTDDQIEYSPESQLKSIRDYAKRNGYILPEEYIFTDEGISGKSTRHRDGFLKMIGTAKIKPKPFDAILLWKFSRFARNREDAILYKSMLRKQLGIEVISISESIGDDKMSVLIEAMIEAMDEYYSINLAEEVRRGMTEKARRGEPQTSAPFGYYMENKTFKIKEEEAEIIRKVFEDYSSGKGFLTIAKELNDIGIRTHRGGRIENRTVDYWLHNPVYCGKCRWTPSGKRGRYDYNNPDTIIAESNHEPIISVELFEKVQEKLQAQKNKYKAHSYKRTGLSSWLSGTIRCSVCGGSYVNCAGYFICNNKNKGGCTGAGSIHEAKMKTILLNYLRQAANGEINDFKFDIPTPSSNKTDVDRLLKKAEQKLSRAKEAYISGIDTLSEYNENKQKILEEISSLKSLSEKETESFSSIPSRDFIIKRIKALIAELENEKISNDEKNDALRSVVSKMIKHKNKIDIVLSSQ